MGSRQGPQPKKYLMTACRNSAHTCAATQQTASTSGTVCRGLRKMYKQCTWKFAEIAGPSQTLAKFCRNQQNLWGIVDLHGACWETNATWGCGQGCPVRGTRPGQPNNECKLKTRGVPNCCEVKRSSYTQCQLVISQFTNEITLGTDLPQQCTRGSGRSE